MFYQYYFTVMLEPMILCICICVIHLLEHPSRISDVMLSVKHCTKTYIPTTWESIGYADGNVLNPAN